MKRNTNKHIRIFLLASSVILLSCHEGRKEEPPKPRNTTLNAEGFVVEPQVFENQYTSTGSLLPNEEIQLLPETSGRVTTISFKEGSHVNKGDVLIRLYNDDIKAQIQKSQAQRALQVKIKERQAKLLDIGGISKQDYETTAAQIASIDADLAYAQAQLSKTIIKAPFNGRIGIRNVSVGAVITPTTVIATLQQHKLLKLDFTLPDQYKDEVMPGKVVSFTVTGSLDTFTASISAAEPSADATTRTLKARAMVDNSREKLIAGSFAHVIIPFSNNKSALLIPSQAIIPTTRDKQVAIARNGKVKMVNVTIGTRTNDMVEVLQGIQPGDTILTTGIMQVKPGMTVKVTKVNKGKV
jgi:membrane fusion protein (multidrug efflux system)